MVTSSMQDEDSYHSSLHDHHYLHVMKAAGCGCLHLERDQFPRGHLVLFAINEWRRELVMASVLSGPAVVRLQLFGALATVGSARESVRIYSMSLETMALIGVLTLLSVSLGADVCLALVISRLLGTSATLPFLQLQPIVTCRPRRSCLLCPFTG
ncbi:hypothetical protein KBY97_06395 [Synechococcus sp. ATX 2A4]|nr:hypothetical protein [Synechococcus sp. ATX 2A4]